MIRLFKSAIYSSKKEAIEKPTRELSCMQPLEDNFYFKQDVSNTYSLSEHMMQHDVTTQLKNIYVFVMRTASGDRLLLAPMVIKKEPKRKRRFFPSKQYLYMSIDDTLCITQLKQLEYGIFKHNLIALLNKMQDNTMPWHLDQNAAIIQANNINYLRRRVALDMQLEKDNQLVVESLYDVFDRMTPDLTDYITKLGRQRLI